MEHNYDDRTRSQGQRRTQQYPPRRQRSQGQQRQQATSQGMRQGGGRQYDRDYDESYAPINTGRRSSSQGQPRDYDRQQSQYDQQGQRRAPQRSQYAQQQQYPQHSQAQRQARSPQRQEQHRPQPQSQAIQRQSVVRPAGSTRIPITGGNPYATNPANPNAPKKRSIVLPILLSLLAIILIAGATFGFLMLRKPKVSVTVNGQEISVAKDSTLDDVKKELEIEVTPGKLLAVDGSVIDEKGGTAQTVVVNGEEISDEDYKAFTFTANGTTVEFSDGKDQEETFTTSESTEPHEGGHDIEATANDYWTGAVHRYQHGQDGIKTTKRGDTSGIEVTEETQARQDESFYIYSVDTGGEKVIALTFDDGPWDGSTDAILDILEANGAKATFFTVGNQVMEHANQVRREKELGCQVCTHTWDHAAGSGQGVNLTYMSSDEQVQEVQKGYDVLRELLGEEPPHIMRAPGGNFYGSIVNTLKPYVDVEVGWDVDTEDWKQPGSSTIYERIMTATAGNVVLMHDGGGDRSQTVEAVRQAVPELIAEGYRLVTIDELLSYGIPATARSL